MRQLKRFQYRAIFVLIVIGACCIISYRKRESNEPLMKQPNIEGDTGWIHPRCNCSKGVTSEQSDIISSCPFASFRGPNQKVITYSFYGETSSGYFKGVSINTKSVAQLYPGWTVRLYHDISPQDKKGMHDLCQVVCKYAHLDECYVGDITDQFPGIDKKFGMLWRFLVMGDATVDIFGVRDLDSPVYQREVDAVNDWLATKHTWHIMRDNPAHVTYILGGMWGARNTNDVKQMQQIRKDLIDEAKSNLKSYDQAMLSKFVWPFAKDDMVAHDSFLCQFFQGTRPWPSERVNRTFVGDMYGISITRKCPEKCRPVDHQDWLYC